MKSCIRSTVVALAVLVVGGSSLAGQPADPFLGRWALTIPNGGAGWLGVTQEDGYLDASILWGGGSVVPVASVYVDDGKLYVTRMHNVNRKVPKGSPKRRHTFTETIVGTVSGNEMSLVQVQPHRDGTGVDRQEFSGMRIPPLPAKPDLSKIKYGEPIELFNGKDLDGWTLTNPDHVNGWSVERHALVNNPVQEKGKPHISYGNLRTVQVFEDFNLKLDVSVPKRGNSGVYLRGIYEVQVQDSYGKELSPHNMGAIYGRIRPTVNAEKRAGKWQTMDITLCDRHVTVVLNGKTIIDNEPLMGCTGGALWSDEFRPGPVYLQGDHTGVKYRDIVLTPILK